MEHVFILSLVSILLLAFLAFFAGRLYELRRQNKKVFDKEVENMKLTEEVLFLHKLAASDSEAETTEAEQPRDKCGKFEKSKRADDPRK